MDSALTPRDIQARIRAGESVEDVAQAAGVPTERVEPFAAPVIAERAHVAGLALSSPVRRRGEHASVRQLRSVTTESLVARGVDPDEVDWDAALLGSRRWQITATFARGKKNHVAQFVYDLNGRFSVAGNDDARWMIGESNARAATAPRTPQPLAEVDDELAIVRAISEPDNEADDAYTEAELAEVDGVYDLVPSQDPEMDALYDMLASFDEDSVRIYTGLVRPEDGPPVSDEPGEVVEPTDVTTTPARPPAGARVEALYAEERVDEVDATIEDTEVLEFDFEDADEPSAAPEPEPEPEAPAAPAEPEQPALVDDGDIPEPTRKPKPKGRRASVPSWDEIMFGAPRKPGDRR